jgi:glycerol-3-phosphate O-acyltransferase
MEKKSTPDLFLAALDKAAKEGSIPEKVRTILWQFYQSYRAATPRHDQNATHQLFLTYLKLIAEAICSPFAFEPYHKQIRQPFDYYTFGLDLLRPLVDQKHSTALGLNLAGDIDKHLAEGHNVILLANHQTEADPQAISLLLEKSHPKLAAEMIFVAGMRVLEDPLAAPGSMGRNLLCIYSKRYIDHPPELKHQKQLHNKQTMQRMAELLSGGGKCIYVAPSGGRDRRSEAGEIEVAPFDPQSIEMFYLMAEKAARPTHFYTLALATYELLPPPDTIQVELGEAREARAGAIHLAFGPEIPLTFPGHDLGDKHARRKARAEYIFEQVKRDYLKLTHGKRL